MSNTLVLVHLFKYTSRQRFIHHYDYSCTNLDLTLKQILKQMKKSEQLIETESETQSFAKVNAKWAAKQIA